MEKAVLPHVDSDAEDSPRGEVEAPRASGSGGWRHLKLSAHDSDDVISLGSPKDSPKKKPRHVLDEPEDLFGTDVEGDLFGPENENADTMPRPPDEGW